MKKEMFGLIFLFSLLLVSFVSAAQYSSTTVVAFNTGDEQPAEVQQDEMKEKTFVNTDNFVGLVSLVLVLIAAVMLYKLKKKRKAKAKAVIPAKKKVAKKTPKKVAKKKVAKKKRK